MMRRVELLSMKGYQPPRAHKGDVVPPTRLQVAERDFRLFAFHIYYDRVYATVNDRNARFLLALWASSRAISASKTAQLMAWYDSPTKRMKRRQVMATLAKLEGRTGRRDEDRDADDE